MNGKFMEVMAPYPAYGIQAAALQGNNFLGNQAIAVKG